MKIHTFFFFCCLLLFTLPLTSSQKKHRSSYLKKPKNALPIITPGLSMAKGVDSHGHQTHHPYDAMAKRLLYKALIEGDDKVILDLISSGAIKPSSKLPGERSLLHAAIIDGYDSTVKLLLDNGWDVNNDLSIHGLTPLSVCVLQGHHLTLSLLLRAGADVLWKKETEPNAGMTALMFAARDGKTDAVNALLASHVSLNDERKSEGASGDTKDTNDKSNSNKNDDDHSNNNSMAASASLYSTDNYFRQPLHFAAGYGHVNTVTALLRKGADVNAVAAYTVHGKQFDLHQNSDTNTKHLASTGASTLSPSPVLPAAPPLSSSSTSKRKKNDRLTQTILHTPLTLALSRKHMDVVEALLDHGSSLNQFIPLKTSLSLPSLSPLSLSSSLPSISASSSASPSSSPLPSPSLAPLHYFHSSRYPVLYPYGTYEHERASIMAGFTDNTDNTDHKADANSDKRGSTNDKDDAEDDKSGGKEAKSINWDLFSGLDFTNYDEALRQIVLLQPQLQPRFVPERQRHRQEELRERQDQYVYKNFRQNYHLYTYQQQQQQHANNPYYHHYQKHKNSGGGDGHIITRGRGAKRTPRSASNAHTSKTSTSADNTRSDSKDADIDPMAGIVASSFSSLPPLMIALHQSRYQILNLLLSRGADPDILGGNDNDDNSVCTCTAIVSACIHSHMYVCS